VKNQNFIKRLGFALNGIRMVWKIEPSFRWQVLCGIGAYVLLFLTHSDLIWWALFSLVIAMVLSAELFNSALERTLDRLHPERHPLIAEAKDCAAGAVLVCSLAALILLACFFFNYFY